MKKAHASITILKRAREERETKGNLFSIEENQQVNLEER